MCGLAVVSGALCRSLTLSDALWRPSILAWTLNHPLAAFGGLWRPLILRWTLNHHLAAFGGPWRPLALCRVFMVLLWAVPRLCGAVEGRAASLEWAVRRSQSRR